MLQQVLGQVPAAIQRPDQLALGHFDAVEEHLTKGRFAADQIDRLWLDAGAAHVQHDQADALVFGHAEVGAYQGVHPVGFVTVRSPDLAAVHHEVIAGIAGGHLQAGQIGTGVRLGETLTPTHFTAGNRWQ
ncbi:hypothetical protein D3C81_1551060 [compost metagenome]